MRWANSSGGSMAMDVHSDSVLPAPCLLYLSCTERRVGGSGWMPRSCLCPQFVKSLRHHKIPPSSTSVKNITCLVLSVIQQLHSLMRRRMWAKAIR
eukprot:2439833-Amphidinium_carterae.1